MGVYVVTGGSGGIGGKTVEILREQDGLDTAPTAATISAARREINRLLQEK